MTGSLNPYTPGELWGGGSEVENCSVCSPSGLLGKSGGKSTNPGQPVDPVTGGYTHQESLFSIGAVGGDLALNLTYDSGLATAQRYDSAAPGYFGYGWESTLSGSLSFPGTSVSLTDDNTAQTTFNRAANDGCPAGDYADFQKYTMVGSAYAFCAANRVDAQLGYFPTYGAYEMNVSGGKETYTYGYLGNLNWIGTNATNIYDELNFTYNETPGSGNCPNHGESSCFVETDENTSPPRTVVAEVDGFGLVQTVWDPFGVNYQLDYTDGDGDLNQIQAPSPDGQPLTTEATFAYSIPGSPWQGSFPYDREMTKYTDGDNNLTTVNYTPTGMVSSILDAYNNTDYYGYSQPGCAIPTSTSCTGTSTTQATQTTTVTYADGEQDTDTFTNGILTSDSWGDASGSGTNTESWSFTYTEPPSTNQDTATVETVSIPGGTSSATIDTDATGNVVSYTDPAGNTTMSMYNDSGGNDLDELCWSAPQGTSIPSNATCSTPPSGATSYTYNSFGEQLSETDPLGNTSQQNYYADGLLCWTAPPTVTASGSACSGNGVGGPLSSAPVGATNYAYDTQGDVVSKAVSAAPSPAQTTTSEYNIQDHLLYTIPPDGQGQGSFGANPYETAYTYEPDGSVASQAGPLGRTTSYTYDNAGNVLVSSDPSGVTTNAYDADNRLCWSYRNSGAYGSTACGSPPASGATRYGGYHANTGSPAAETDPDGNTTNYTYADNRFPTKATTVTQATVPNNPQPNIVTNTSYDAFGDTCVNGPVAVTLASCSQVGGDTTDQYNAEGQLNDSYDPDGQDTHYTYADKAFPTDATSVKNPLSEVTQYNYDADGHLVSAIDPEGQTVTTAYDADGRPCAEAPFATLGSCASPPGGTGVTVLSYDQAGQRIQMIDNYGAGGQVTDSYNHDASGNVLSSTNDNGQTNSYAYDDANEITCTSYAAIAGSSCSGTPSGSFVTRSYNGAGELQSTTDWLGNTIQYSNYNALSEVRSITYPSSTGVSLSYSYDAAGNVTGLSYLGAPIPGLSGSDSWTPNANDQVGASSSVNSYSSLKDTYDQYDRVRQATNPATVGSQSGADTYGYDPDGDLKTDTLPNSSQITYGYNQSNTGNELTSVTNPNNPANSRYESLNYNADGQRCWSNWSSSVSSQACGSAPPGATQYSWNTYGQLCGSGTTSGAPTCSPGTGYTGYTYDGNNLLSAMTTGSTTQKFNWDSASGSIPLDLSDGNNSYVYGPLLFGGTAPIEQISSGATPTVSFLASTQSGVQTVFGQGSQTSATSAADTFTYGSVSPVGTLASQNGTGRSTLSVSPQHVGDALVLSAGIGSSTISISSVSGGGATWQKLTNSLDSAGANSELWLGTVTGTGASTITVTYSASVSSTFVELDAQEFTNGTGATTTWAADVVGHTQNNTATTTVTFPALTPSAPGEAYVGYGYMTTPAGAGTTSGFTYDSTSASNSYIYDTNVSAAVSPTATESPAGESDTVAALLKATVPRISSVGSLASQHAMGQSTLSVTPQNLGDALVLSVGISSSSTTVSSVTGGGASWQRVEGSLDSSGGTDTELWLGTISSTGSSTITVSFSASVSSTNTELSAQEYTNGTGATTTWSGDVGGYSHNLTSSTTVTYPSLTPAGGGELYVGYGYLANTAASGSTSGFTYDSTPWGNAYIYDTNVSTAVSPTGAQSPAGDSDTVGALLKAAVPSTGSSPVVTNVAAASGSADGGTSVVITGINFTGTTAVHFGATAATSFTVNSSTSITAVAPAGSAGTVNVTVTGPSGLTLYEQAAYTVFGQQVVQAGTDFSPFGFQGSYTLPSGLIYLINRYYDPSTAQFLSIDPKVTETGQPYAYTGDDPLNATDPLGLFSFGHLVNPCDWGNACRHVHNATKRIIRKAPKLALSTYRLSVDVPQDASYLLYWGSYEAAGHIVQSGCSHGGAACAGAHALALPFVPAQAVGLAGDVAGNYLKGEKLAQGEVPNTPLLGNDSIGGVQAGRDVTHDLGLPTLQFPGYDVGSHNIQIAW